ncbi:hypothetical protein PR048_013601 [Dryococelus australis]|uniref:Uncharacterized protein n=1 Tax=Dryococelus australis TaxID=614101 RepID=A0ABQ9HSN4_9NEOP|nr:hypothetical protein PR048_013601 [Dryococelus australis]
MEKHQNESQGNNRTLRKPTDQQHCMARFPHVEIQEYFKVPKQLEGLQWCSGQTIRLLDCHPGELDPTPKVVENIHAPLTCKVKNEDVTTNQEDENQNVRSKNDGDDGIYAHSTNDVSRCVKQKCKQVCDDKGYLKLGEKKHQFKYSTLIQRPPKLDKLLLTSLQALAFLTTLEPIHTLKLFIAVAKIENLFSGIKHCALEALLPPPVQRHCECDFVYCSQGPGEPMIEFIDSGSVQMVCRSSLSLVSRVLSPEVKNGEESQYYLSWMCADTIGLATTCTVHTPNTGHQHTVHIHEFEEVLKQVENNPSTSSHVEHKLHIDHMVVSQVWQEQQLHLFHLWAKCVNHVEKPIAEDWEKAVHEVADISLDSNLDTTDKDDLGSADEVLAVPLTEVSGRSTAHLLEAPSRQSVTTPPKMAEAAEHLRPYRVYEGSSPNLLPLGRRQRHIMAPTPTQRAPVQEPDIRHSSPQHFRVLGVSTDLHPHGPLQELLVQQPPVAAAATFQRLQHLLALPLWTTPGSGRKTVYDPHLPVLAVFGVKERTVSHCRHTCLVRTSVYCLQLFEDIKCCTSIPFHVRHGTPRVVKKAEFSSAKQVYAANLVAPGIEIHGSRPKPLDTQGEWLLPSGDLYSLLPLLGHARGSSSASSGPDPGHREQHQARVHQSAFLQLGRNAVESQTPGRTQQQHHTRHG